MTRKLVIGPLLLKIKSSMDPAKPNMIFLFYTNYRSNYSRTKIENQNKINLQIINKSFLRINDTLKTQSSVKGEINENK